MVSKEYTAAEDVLMESDPLRLGRASLVNHKQSIVNKSNFLIIQSKIYSSNKFSQNFDIRNVFTTK